jgi:hypothetical protein
MPTKKQTLRCGLLAASLWLAAISSAFAQTYMPIPPNSVIGNVQGQSGPSYAITFSELASQLRLVGLGIQPITCAAHAWLNTISIAGVPACAQPSFSDISGQATLAQLPSLVTTAGTGLSLTGGGTTLNLALTNATLTATPTSPTGTTNSTGVMMGLGTTCKITPVYSGRVWVTFSGVAANSVATSSFIASVRFGTGTAPANAAALSGTTVGAGFAGTSTAAGQGTPFGGMGGIITGLTVGTAIWFDMGLSATPSGAASLTTLTCTAMEF